MSIIIFKQLITMMIYVTIGYILFKTKTITAKDTRYIGTFLIKVITPAVVLNSFLIDYSSHRNIELLESFVMAIIVMFISMLICYILYRKDHEAMFAISFPNVAYMGLPIVTNLLGIEDRLYVMPIMVLVVVANGFYATLLFGAHLKDGFKRVIKMPTIYAFILGYIIFISGCGTKLDPMIADAIGGIASMTTPMAMILCGIYLGEIGFRNIFHKKTIFNSLVRLVLIPFITIMIIRLIPAGRELITVLSIECLCACGTNVAIYAHQYEKDYTYTTSLVMVSTIFSVIITPLMAYLLGL